MVTLRHRLHLDKNVNGFSKNISQVHMCTYINVSLEVYIMLANVFPLEIHTYILTWQIKVKKWSTLPFSICSFIYIFFFLLLLDVFNIYLPIINNILRTRVLYHQTVYLTITYIFNNYNLHIFNERVFIFIYFFRLVNN